MNLLYFALCLIANSQATLDEQSKVYLRDEGGCTAQELEQADLYQNSCSGAWTYEVYDCWKEGDAEFSHYGSLPIIGFKSCAHPDHGPDRWKIFERHRYWLYGWEFLNHSDKLQEKVIATHGPGAFAVWDVFGDFWGSTRGGSFPNASWNQPIKNYVETYYVPSPDGGYEVHATYHHEASLGYLQTRAPAAMANARANLGDSAVASVLIPRPVCQGVIGGACPPDHPPGFTATIQLLEGMYRGEPAYVEQTTFVPTRWLEKQHETCETIEVGRQEDFSQRFYVQRRQEGLGHEGHNVCGAFVTPIVTRANMLRSEIPEKYNYARELATCETNDSVDQTKSPSERFDDLRNSWRGQTHTDYDRTIVQKIKHLTERHGADLDAEQQFAAIEFFSESPRHHLCGASRLSAAQWRREPEAAAALDRCSRLSLRQVRPRERIEFVPTCLKHRGPVTEITQELGLATFVLLKQILDPENPEAGAKLCSQDPMSDLPGLTLIASWYDATQAWGLSSREALEGRDFLQMRLLDTCAALPLAPQE